MIVELLSRKAQSKNSPFQLVVPEEHSKTKRLALLTMILGVKGGLHTTGKQWCMEKKITVRDCLRENSIRDPITGLQHGDAVTSLWGTYQQDRFLEIQNAAEHSPEAYTFVVSRIETEVAFFAKEALIHNERASVFASIPAEDDPEGDPHHSV